MAETYHLSLFRRILNRLVHTLSLLGRGPKNTYLLTVPGRRSGKPRTTPVIVLPFEGGRWIVAPYGPRDWVLNARAEGKAELRRGRRRERVALEEVDAETAAPVLKRYAEETPITRPYFDARPGDPVEAFRAEAGKHPVFRLVTL